MAGAGYKLFSTGDVLTATDVNTYLMQQTVMVFNDATARTTALAGVVAEGMLSYLKDTNAVEVYDGANWVSSDDPNAIQNTIVAAKGDIIGASANDVPAVTSVGADGTTLVADSSTSTGLSYQANFAAGKNKIINAAFSVAQRGTSFSNPTSGAYNLDRFFVTYNGSTTPTQTISQQSLNGAISALNQPNYMRIAITTIGSGQTNEYFAQRIEDVTTITGAVTLSFYAKADTNRTLTDVGIGQVFGSGGSTRVDTSFSNIAITTSWTRYTVTATLPSVSGKTIGAGSYLELYFNIGAANGLTFDIAGIQLEAGSTATAFQTATGTIQGELAACQRYCVKYTTDAADKTLASGTYYGATTFLSTIHFPTMRTAPTATIVNATNYWIIYANGTSDTCDTASFASATLNSGNLEFSGNVSGTQGHGGQVRANNASASIILSAEL